MKKALLKSTIALIMGLFISSCTQNKQSDTDEKINHIISEDSIKEQENQMAHFTLGVMRNGTGRHL